ncbi:hypothetical protein [Catenuloplanes indicus]|uniref:Uncharacterized protein n=1 Tax=Catenuloplanes indicus TaxID=137267 RepID=A0AAE3W953_9ACTN|nr:hypothetical protein [Catenuloplanes indicus]MDQ0371562.1 hypothetical protein [Catenuloplanes indicus]
MSALLTPTAVSTVAVEPQHDGAHVGLFDPAGFDCHRIFTRLSDGTWTDDHGDVHVWAEIEHAARIGGYIIREVQRAVTG